MIKKLNQNKWHFSDPSIGPEDQQVLLNEFCALKFSGQYFENMAKIANIEANELKSFITNLFDNTKKDIEITLPDGRKETLHFLHK